MKKTKTPKAFFKKGDLLRVVWTDAHGGASWRNENEMEENHRKSCTVVSIGECFRHDEKGITLVSGYDNTFGAYLGYHHSPAAYIESIEKLSSKPFRSRV
jgi:hypothetical protein